MPARDVPAIDRTQNSRLVFPPRLSLRGSIPIRVNSPNSRSKITLLLLFYQLSTSHNSTSSTLWFVFSINYQLLTITFPNPFQLGKEREGKLLAGCWRSCDTQMAQRSKGQKRSTTNARIQVLTEGN